MLGTILTLCEASLTAHSMYKSISSIVFGDKTEKYLKEISDSMNNMNAHIEKLSENILYAVNFDGVRANDHRYLDDFKDIHERLQHFQKAVNQPVLASAMIAAPRQMTNIDNPEDFFLDIFPLNNSPTKSNDGLIPVLFEENGEYYTGWHYPENLGCDYQSRWQPNQQKIPAQQAVNISNLVDNSPSEGGIWTFQKPIPAPIPKSKDFEVFRDNLKDGSQCPEMVWIPAGSFQMGSEEDDDEKPVHEVSVDGFAIGKYQVTFEEYDKFAEAMGKDKPSDSGWGRGKHPVINVSWRDAVAYAKWLSEQTGHTYRLPTEAEWEYMARAGTTTRYCFGDDESGLSDYAWYRKNSSSKTHPVGEKKANAWGLHDVHGNVWEWTYSEYHDKYQGDENTCNNQSSLFVLRGGSWFSYAAGARTAYRLWFDPTARYRDYGFRLSRTK